MLIYMYIIKLVIYLEILCMYVGKLIIFFYLLVEFEDKLCVRKGRMLDILFNRDHNL